VPHAVVCSMNCVARLVPILCRTGGKGLWTKDMWRIYPMDSYNFPEFIQFIFLNVNRIKWTNNHMLISAQCLGILNVWIKCFRWMPIGTNFQKSLNRLPHSLDIRKYNVTISLQRKLIQCDVMREILMYSN